MRLTAVIRPVETRTLEVEGEDYVGTREKLLASVPEGYEIVGPISTVRADRETASP